MTRTLIALTTSQLIAAYAQAATNAQAKEEILLRMENTKSNPKPTAARVRAYNMYAQLLGVEGMEYVRKDGSVLSFDKTSPKPKAPAKAQPKASKAPAKAQSPKPKASAKSSTSARLDALEAQMSQILSLLQGLSKQ